MRWVIAGDMNDWTTVHVQVQSLPQGYPLPLIDVIEVDDTVAVIMSNKDELEEAVPAQPPEPEVRRLQSVGAPPQNKNTNPYRIEIIM